MIITLDKVIYGLGALTFVGVVLIVTALVLFFLAAIIMGIVDLLKNVNRKEKKVFGGSNERSDRNNKDKQEPPQM